MTSMKETAVNKNSVTVSELAITGACIALTFVATGFINIRLPLPGNGGLVHLGNVPLFLAAMIYGKRTGALSQRSIMDSGGMRWQSSQHAGSRSQATILRKGSSTATGSLRQPPSRAICCRSAWRQFWCFLSQRQSEKRLHGRQDKVCIMQIVSRVACGSTENDRGGRTVCTRS